MTPSKEDYPFRVVHADGCGGDAFFLKKRPTHGDTAISADAIYPDGKPIDRESAMRCGSCGEFIREPPKLAWVRPRE